MSKIRLNNSEVISLSHGDHMLCLACGCCIFIYEEDQVDEFIVTMNYYGHLRKCFGLKRTIVNTRNGKTQD